jgi:hypothetical protein
MAGYYQVSLFANDQLVGQRRFRVVVKEKNK